jgi:MFS family permease
VAERANEPESAYAWVRLVAALLLGTIGGVGMWSYVVALPAVQADFGVDRAGATVPYILSMLGFGLGGVLMGRVADRLRIMVPIVAGALLLGAGYVLGSLAGTLWAFSLAQGVLIGIGMSATFSPLIADISLWFTRRRGIAVALAASGNYLSGTLWPPVVQHFVQAAGWRPTYLGIGLFCVATMLPLALVLRRAPPPHALVPVGTRHTGTPAALGLSSHTLMLLLAVAGVGCCVAMSMPQVHIVAYCGDLGYGPARGAEMLSLMLGFGIVSRIASGFIADRFGGLRTLLLGSVLQGLALCMYLLSDGLASLYVISALFGLFQGGIVPSYAIIVREYFPAREAGTRIGIVMMSTLLGMALGGWLSGEIFDLTGSYRAAFGNGILWNLLNGGIVLSLLLRSRRGRRLALA